MNLLGKRTRKQSVNVPAQTVPQADYDTVLKQLEQSTNLNNELAGRIIDLEHEVRLLKQRCQELEDELDRPIIG